MSLLHISQDFVIWSGTPHDDASRAQCVLCSRYGVTFCAVLPPHLPHDSRPHQAPARREQEEEEEDVVVEPPKRAVSPLNLFRLGAKPVRTHSVLQL